MSAHKNVDAFFLEQMQISAVSFIITCNNPIIMRRKMMNINTMTRIEEFEETIMLCNGRPKGEELPQVIAEKEILSELLNQTAY